MTRKICVVVTARPSYSRIRSALHAMDKRPDIDLQIVLAASALLDRYGDVSKQVEADGFTVAARVYMVLEGENPASMAKTTGIGVLELATAFDNLKPDAVVTIADRYETIATAIAASYMNVPLIHVQGGEVTGSIDEKVRHAITKLADLHLVASEPARDRLIRMGEEPDSVHVTGCPSLDIAREVRDERSLDFDPFERYGGVGHLRTLDADYVVVMQHPVTTEYEESRAHILNTLAAVRDLDMQVLWFWPNVDAGSDGTSKGIRQFREEHDARNFHFFKNMSPTDFLKILVNARCLIGNSSAGIRESSYLGVPAVNIGTRQAGRDRACNVRDVGYEPTEIVEAAREMMNGTRPKPSDLYGDGHAGPRIAELSASAPLDVRKRLTY